MKIDPAQFKPAWTHTIVLRNREIPLLPPEKVDAADDLRGARHRGLIHAPKRFGAWLHRVIFGVTPTNELRDAVMKCLPRDCAPLAAELTADELLDVFNAYVAAQADYRQRQQDALVAALADEGRGSNAEENGGGGGFGASSASMPGALDASMPSTLRMPGVAGQIPQALRGVVKDNRKGPGTGDRGPVAEGAHA